MEAGVPCGPINRVSDVVNDPQVLARNMIVPAMASPRAGDACAWAASQAD